MLTREQILQADDLVTEEIEISEWRGSVIVRTLTGKERDKFEASFVSKKGNSRDDNMKNIRARFVSLIVVNEKGERLFNDDDALELGKKSSAALDKVFAVGQKLNGMSPDDVEDMVKN